MSLAALVDYGSNSEEDDDSSGGLVIGERAAKRAKTVKNEGGGRLKKEKKEKKKKKKKKKGRDKQVKEGSDSDQEKSSILPSAADALANATKVVCYGAWLFVFSSLTISSKSYILAIQPEYIAKFQELANQGTHISSLAYVAHTGHNNEMPQPA
jgi:hypothetical protein